MSVEDTAQLADAAITLLLEFPFRQSAEPLLRDALHGVMNALSLNNAAISAWKAQSAPLVTCYIGTDPLVASPAEMRDIVSMQLRAVASGDIELSRLRAVAIHQGASHQQKAPFHYVVRTDVEPGGDQELQRWYAEEHMAMLAAVPGTVQARRYISLDAAPRYYACYDLLAPAVLTSAQWLTARATPWSARVRPTFRNTRRVIFSKLEL